MNIPADCVSDDLFNVNFTPSVPIRFVIPCVEDRFKLGLCIKRGVLENANLNLKLFWFANGLSSLCRICFLKEEGIC